jgi:crotonobetainyl-CoA:carnitine CoA-transferase CaiB-like acyl-CoA transferase
MSRLNSFLNGLRVIDVSAHLPGPFASLLLSDMGADVVKVQPPQGDGRCPLGPCDPGGPPALCADVAVHFTGLRLSECEARFAGADCCLSPVLDLAEALHGAHHQARGVVRSGPDGGLQALFPVLVDGQPPALRSDMTARE